MIGFNGLGRWGRLGNQMFQYAALLAIAQHHNCEFCIPPPGRVTDRSFLDEGPGHQLLDAFDMPSLRCVGWVRSQHVHRESTFAYDEEYVKSCPRHSELAGQFNTERYFRHISDIIKTEFAFKESVAGRCRDGIAAINKPCISLHVRRGDYVALSAYHPPLPLEYYADALKLVPEDLPVIVFSDDIPWCREQPLFRGSRWKFSEGNSNIDDLCLMTLCSHHIIANSTFSWWGAWLGHNPSRTVVAPDRWLGPAYAATHDTRDVLPPEWKTAPSQ
jgi:hypothetical protein